MPLSESSRVLTALRAEIEAIDGYDGHGMDADDPRGGIFVMREDVLLAVDSVMKSLARAQCEHGYVIGGSLTCFVCDVEPSVQPDPASGR